MEYPPPRISSYGQLFQPFRPCQASSAWRYSYIVRVPGFKVPRKKISKWCEIGKLVGCGWRMTKCKVFVLCTCWTGSLLHVGESLLVDNWWAIFLYCLRVPLREKQEKGSAKNKCFLPAPRPDSVPPLYFRTVISFARIFLSMSLVV